MNLGHLLNPEQLDALHRSIEDPLATGDPFHVDLKLGEFDLQIHESDATKHEKYSDYGNEPRRRERAKSMVHPIFATLIFDGELACLNLFGVVVGTAPPRHDEIRA